MEIIFIKNFFPKLLFPKIEKSNIEVKNTIRIKPQQIAKSSLGASKLPIEHAKTHPSPSLKNLQGAQKFNREQLNTRFIYWNKIPPAYCNKDCVELNIHSCVS
jgi:hypothetical protein